MTVWTVLKGDDDFTPFRNIMNEFYARDTSRKIRSVFKSKGMSGKHLTGTVIYGYLWDEKREHWIVTKKPPLWYAIFSRLQWRATAPISSQQVVRRKNRNACRSPCPLWRRSKQE